jgi:SecD/SecF fusion protein
MRNKSFVIVLSVILVTLCAYFLSFTIISRGVNQNSLEYATDSKGNVDFAKQQEYLDSVWNEPVYNLLGLQYTLKEVKEIELNLGLDLQGGMHVTMEVSPVEIIKVMSGNNPDANFLKAIKLAEERQKSSQDKFINLFAKAFKETSPNNTLANIFSNSTNRGKIDGTSSDEVVIKVLDDEIEMAIDRSFNILRTRIDKFGVANPNIQRLQGTGRIQIELPGVSNPERVRKLLQGVAKLEFLEVWQANEYVPYFNQMNDYLVAKEKTEKDLGIDDSELNTEEAKSNDDVLTSTFEGDSAKTDDLLSSSTDSTSADSISAKSSSLLAKLFVPLSQQGDLGSNVKDTAKVNKLLATPEIKALFPSNMRFLWAVKPFLSQDGKEFLQLYFVKKGRDGKAPLTGEVITEARQDFDQNGRPEISMQMNSIGAKKWKKLTGDNVNRQIAIVLDDYVYSAPNVQGEIAGGNSSISGNFTIEEAKDLANILKAGKLPAPTRIVEEAIVGPSLGKEAIQQGLMSSIAGLALVIVFMFMYYGKGGMFSNLALLFNIFFIFGILAQFGAALTLPGIAGIVLTMGMAVDANVLIFERIKEELQKGKSISSAIQLGFDKAYSAIIDSNATTFLIAAILYVLGSGPIKGFAITLMIGIASSFFTAVFITRLLIEALFAKGVINESSFTTFISANLMKKFNLALVSKRKIGYAFSGTVIVIGMILLVVQGGLNLGVDFKGGRSYVVKLENALPADEIKSKLSAGFENASTEVKTFGSSNTYKVITSYLVENEGAEADIKVENALMKTLKTVSGKDAEILSSAKVGATIADDIKNSAQNAVFFGIAIMFLYILIRFRKWQYSLGATIALLHDVLFVIAVTSIASMVGIKFEVDQVFLAAILTVIGYSINDTVVVFDRVREFTEENPSSELENTVNNALNTTLNRTLMTSITTLLVVVVLFIFGGELLRGFSFVLLTGIAVGTYSSIFIASPVVVDFTKKLKK